MEAASPSPSSNPPSAWKGAANPQPLARTPSTYREAPGMRRNLTFLILVLVCFGCGSPQGPVTATPASELDQGKTRGVEQAQLTAYEVALPDLERAAQLDPEDGEVAYYLFLCYRHAEKEPHPSSKAYPVARKVTKLLSDAERSQEAQEYLEAALPILEDVHDQAGPSESVTSDLFHAYRAIESDSTEASNGYGVAKELVK